MKGEFRKRKNLIYTFINGRILQNVDEAYILVFQNVDETHL